VTFGGYEEMACITKKLNKILEGILVHKFSIKCKKNSE
jgi:hypothetical protein